MRCIKKLKWCFSELTITSVKADQIYNTTFRLCETSLTNWPVALITSSFFVTTFGAVVLNLVFLSELLRCSDVKQLPPVTDSDYKAQLWQVHLSTRRQVKFRCRINYNAFNSSLNTVAWTFSFYGCATKDNFAALLYWYNIWYNKSVLNLQIYISSPILAEAHRTTSYKPRRAHGPLASTQEIFQACRIARNALRQHKRCAKVRLIFSIRPTSSLFYRI